MTQSIQLTDVIAYYKGLEHQKAAIAYLQNNIPKQILDKFAEMWRTAPKAERVHLRFAMSNYAHDALEKSSR